MTAEEPCPICGKQVIVGNVTVWYPDTGEISEVEYECETEPDIDAPDYGDWLRGHWQTPYIDWLPYSERLRKRLNERFRYDGEKLVPR